MSMTPNKSDAVTEAWNKVREEARAVSGGRFGLGDLLSAVDAYAIAVAVDGGQTFLASSGQAASAVPEGWKLVPSMPTQAMLDRARGYSAFESRGNAESNLRGMWAAMLAASPTQPASAPAREGATTRQGFPDPFHGWDATPAAPAQPREDLREARNSANDYVLLTREVIEAIASERTRQKTEEGHWPNGDRYYNDEQLARAAAVYANPEIWNVFGAGPIGWPWRADSYKPTTRRRDLIKAAALIVAQLERDHRASEDAANGGVTYKPFLEGGQA